MRAPEIETGKECAASALEIAKGLALGDDNRFWQVKLQIQSAGADGGPLDLFGSDGPEGLYAVAKSRSPWRSSTRRRC